MPLDVSGLTKLDTSGLTKAGTLDTTGLTKLDTTGLTPLAAEPAAEPEPSTMAGFEPAPVEDAEPAASESGEFSKGVQTGIIGAKQMGVAAASILPAAAQRNYLKVAEGYDAIDRGEHEETPRGAQVGQRGDFVFNEIERYRMAPPEEREKLRARAESRLASSAETKSFLLDAWKQYQEEMKGVAGRRTDVTEIGSVQDFADWFAFNFGQGLPYIAASVLAGVVGGLPGVIGVGLGTGVGDIQSERIEKGVGDQAPTSVFLAAPLYAALDFLGPAGRMFRGVGRKGLTEAAESYFKRAGKEIPKNAVEEFINEAGQEIVKDAAVTSETGEKLITEESLKRWLNAGAAGAAAGGPFGAIEAATGKKDGGPAEPPRPVDGWKPGQPTGSPLDAIAVPGDATPPAPTTAPVTEADIASPIPTDMIAEGRAIIDGAIREQNETVARETENVTGPEITDPRLLEPLPAPAATAGAPDAAAEAALGQPAQAGSAPVVEEEAPGRFKVKVGGFTYRGDKGRPFASREEAEAFAATKAPAVGTTDPQSAPAPEVVATTGLQGDGTRTAPVRVRSDADLDHARDLANPDPTAGQAEAGNYQMIHAKVGTDEVEVPVSIETPKDGIRRSKDPANPWEVTMPADYGYIKGTKGADGDGFDVYVGPKPSNGEAWIVDQFDPKTGKFDEHKGMIGFESEAAAIAAYDAGFSDGSGPRRRGAVSGVTLGELKTYAFSNPGTAFAPGATAPKQIDTKGLMKAGKAAAPKLDTAGMMKVSKAKPASDPRATFEKKLAKDHKFEHEGVTYSIRYDAARGTSLWARTEGKTKIEQGPKDGGWTDGMAAKAAADHAFPPEAAPVHKVIKPRKRASGGRERPIDVLEFIASIGGIRDDAGHDLKGMGLQRLIPGSGMLIRENGRHLGDISEELMQAGYFEDLENVPDEAVVLNLLERAARKKVYKPNEEHLATAMAAEKDDDRQLADIRDEVADIARDRGEPLKPAEIAEIAKVVAGGGVTTEEAIVDFVERQAMETLEDAGSQVQDGDYGIPWEAEREGGDPAPEEGERGLAPEARDEGGGGTRGPPAEEVPAGEVASEDDARYVVKALRYGKGFSTFLNRRFVYFSPLRPLGFGFPIKGAEYDPKHISASVDASRVLVTDEAVPIGQLNRLELQPVTGVAKLAAFKEAYAATPGIKPGRYEMVNPNDRDIGDGAVITPSTKGEIPTSGKFQLTYFDSRGFRGDLQYDTIDEAIGSALSMHYYEPAPGHLKDMAALDTFKDVDAVKAAQEALFQAAEAKRKPAAAPSGRWVVVHKDTGLLAWETDRRGDAEGLGEKYEIMPREEFMSRRKAPKAGEVQDATQIMEPSELDGSRKFTLPRLYRGVEGGTDAKRALRRTKDGDLGDAIYLTQHEWLAETYGGGPKSSVKDGSRVVHTYELARELFPEEVAFSFKIDADQHVIVTGNGIELYRGKWTDPKFNATIDKDDGLKVLIGAPGSVTHNQIGVKDAGLLREPATVEKVEGVDGSKDQLVVPGAEQKSPEEVAAAKKGERETKAAAEKRLAGAQSKLRKGNQKSVADQDGGLFADAAKKDQGDLLSAPPAKRRPSETMPTASWVLREKVPPYRVIAETYDKAKVDALNTSKYEAVPAADHLADVNEAVKFGLTIENYLSWKARGIADASIPAGEPGPKRVAPSDRAGFRKALNEDGEVESNAIIWSVKPVSLGGAWEWGSQNATDRGNEIPPTMNGDPTGKGWSRNQAIQAAYEDAFPDTKGDGAPPPAPKPAPPKPTSWGEKNTITTKDKAAELRAELLRELKGTASSGINPKVMAIGAQLAAFHIEAGARKFVDFAHAIASDLGMTIAELTPYLRAWYTGAQLMMEDAGHLVADMDNPDQVRAGLASLKEEANAPSSIDGLEPDSGSGAAADGVRPPAVSAPRSRAGRGSRSRGGRSGGKRDIGLDSQGSFPDRSPSPVGGPSGDQIRPGEPTDGGSDSSPGGQGGGGDLGDEGVQPDRTPAEAVDRVAVRPDDLEAKRAEQRAADKVAIKPGLDNIRETLPFLKKEQQEDVAAVETRFAKPDGHGFLFANGTGTGKTYSGGGVIKRFVRQGKDGILVLAPSQDIASEWVKALDNLSVPASILESTQTAGTGVVVSTYANAGENGALADRKWDLVVADESHKLMSSAQGETTDALRAVRAITNHPRGHYDRAKMALREKWKPIDELMAAYKKARKDVPREVQERAAALYRETTALSETYKGLERGKAVFLSATPFAYVEAIDYAEGYLFSYGEEPKSGAYNTPDARGAFFMQHFGYRMRTGKLTKPDADVNSEVMEREFHEWMKREGSLVGRALEIDADYDRKFVLVDDAIGNQIDQLMDFLESADNRRFSGLAYVVRKRFDYLARMRLLEAIKAHHAVKIIKAHHALGRKVVVFHDYNEGGGINPFEFDEGQLPQKVRSGDKDVPAWPLYQEFLARNPDVAKMKFADMQAPILTLTRAFPGALVYNGTVPVKKRREAKRLFNEDGNEHNLIIVQSAAGEAGISLHDTTGKHQRVSLNLGMPVRPTTATQEEGRTRRLGSVTDSLFRYMNTGTNWERWTFADKIADRAGTAENLALGNLARALKQSFIDAFNDSDTYPATVDEGKGGKEADRAMVSTMSPFERAKTFYLAQQKKTGRRDQREGIDYFATPEPVGFKMVEWANVKLGQKILEPSAGHGAIARFFPETTNRTLIEPSSGLASKAALASPGARVLAHGFEDLHKSNKYDAIVMNPPYGVGGKTAIEHLALAVTHLKNGGRIVAIIPDGGMATKRFDAFMEADASKGVYLVADISMPTVTFDRAGTSVKTRIVVLDKQTDPEVRDRLQQVSRDYSNADSVGALFDRIENGSVPDRLEPTTKDVETVEIPDEGKITVGGVEFLIYQEGEKEFHAGPKSKIGKDRFASVARLAEKAGGRYYARTFSFPTKEGRSQFLSWMETPPPPEPVEAVAAADKIKLGETRHAKTGEKLFVASLVERLDRDSYLAAVAIAKQNGGWYSSYEKYGAIPGFQFKNAESRAKFVAEMTGGETMAAVESDAFYSALEEAVAKLPLKGTGAQMLASLRNMPGVKPAEIVATGIDTWLPAQDRVTREQVAEYVAANKVEIREVTKSGGAPKPTGAQVGRVEAWLESSGNNESENRVALRDAAAGDRDSVGTLEGLGVPGNLLAPFRAHVGGESGPKFAGYVLPGGENYREVLLTLPASRGEARLRELELKRVGGSPMTVDEREEYHALRESGVSDSQNFRGGHFDEPNVLAHIRLNDRTDADGKRVLFVEEIQSDWHQKGRRNGYRASPAEQKRLDDEREAARQEFVTANRRVIEKATGGVYHSKEEVLQSGSRAMLNDVRIAQNDDPDLLQAKARVEEAERNQERGRGGPPDAPWKKDWHELALRRVLKMAADQGYDRVAWTTGEQQNERYDLSKRLESVNYEPPPKNGVRTAYVLSAKDRNGRKIDLGAHEAAELDGVVGKELADKIRAGEGEPIARVEQVREDNGKVVFQVVERGRFLGNYPTRAEAERRVAGLENSERQFSGLDLKVGGSGMVGFYDKMLVAYANKFGAKYGAKVGEANIGQAKPLDDIAASVYGSGETYENLPEESRLQVDRVARRTPPVTVHALDITPELHAAIGERGVPLFAAERDQGGGAAGRDLSDAQLEEIAVELQRLAGQQFGGLKVAARATPIVDADGRSLAATYRRTPGFGAVATVSIRSSDGRTRSPEEIAGLLGHEGVHFLRDLKVLRGTDWNILLRAEKVNGWRDLFKIERNYSRLSEAKKSEESIAHAYGKWLRDGKAPTGTAGIFARLNRFIEALGNFLMGRGFRSHLAIFEAIRRGDYSARSRAAVDGARGRSGAGDMDMVAYHGTRKRGIDKFSTAFIGTGEGAQVYGWGLYFATRRGIAEHYQKALSGAPRDHWEVALPEDDRIKLVARGLRDRATAALRRRGDPANMIPNLEKVSQIELVAMVKRVVEGADPYGALPVAISRYMSDEYGYNFSVADMVDTSWMHFLSEEDRRMFSNARLALSWTPKTASPAEALKELNNKIGVIPQLQKREADQERSVKELEAAGEKVLAGKTRGELFDTRRILEEYEDIRDVLERYPEAAPRPPDKKGALYTVDLAPAEDEYLDWDRPVSEQSPKVKAGLLAVAKEIYPGLQIEEAGDGARNKFRITTRDGYIGRSRTKSAGDLVEAIFDGTGERAYKEIVSRLEAGAVGRNFDGQRAASEALRAAGIRGNKYKDASSRNVPEVVYVVLYPAMGGRTEELDFHDKAKAEAFAKDMPGATVEERRQGTHNYVIFDEADISIVGMDAVDESTRPPKPPVVQPAPRFANPASEDRWQKARQGAGGAEAMVQRIVEWGRTIKNGFTRHYIALPNEPRFSDVAQQLRKLEAAPQAAREEIVRTLRAITRGMNAADLDLFTRKVVIDDLAYEVEQEHALPFGLSDQDVLDAKAAVDAAMALRPDLQWAVDQRAAYSQAIADEMVEAGVLHKEQVKNPHYYRHQVLEYAMAQNKFLKSAPQKLRSPHWAKRHGSLLDINANYLEAEFEWLDKALVNIAEARTIQGIKDSKHNILLDLRAQAKAHNKAAFDQLMASEGPDGPIHRVMAGFSQRIAMGLSFVRRAIDDNLISVPAEFQATADALMNDTDSPDLFRFLAWIMDTNQAGASGAGITFKAISHRKEFVKEMLGDTYADPLDTDGLVRRFAPDGYVAWRPEEGKMLFLAKTIPEHVADKLLGQIAAAGVQGAIPASELQAAMASVRPMLAVAGDKYALVIPEELAETLNSLRDSHAETIINKLFEVPLRLWKRWVLINPRRYLKYNLNNLSGDLDAVIAGNPKALRRMGQAIKELYAVMYQKKEPSERYKEAVARGVFDSGLTVQEIPDINVMAEFSHLIERQSALKRPDKFALSGLLGMWRALQKSTQFRENWVRYAAYLDYVERIEAGESMRSIGYGASKPEMVDAVEDDKDRAALLARDLVGDYGNVSHFGQQLRRTTIPFYSWMEINTKRYWRLGINAWSQGAVHGMRATGSIAALKGIRWTAWLHLRMAAVYATIVIYNMLFHGDDQDDLSDEEKLRLYVMLGRDDDGQVRMLRLQGAFSDFLAWFGYEDVISTMQEVNRGRGSYADVLGALFKAPVQKVANGLTPIIKVPMELAAGMSFWPDMLRPMPVRDNWRHIARTFSMEHEYDAIMERPSRGYGRSLAETLVYKRDPGENAYNQSRTLAYQWMKREKGIDGTSSFTSPRSEALRDYRTALRYGDREAAEDAKGKLRVLGATQKDIEASIKRAHPIAPIPVKDRPAFLRSMTDQERAAYDRAVGWYNETFTD